MVLASSVKICKNSLYCIVANLSVSDIESQRTSHKKSFIDDNSSRELNVSKAIMVSCKLFQEVSQIEEYE